MTTTSPLASHPSRISDSGELYGFRDSVSGMTLRFYRPNRRFDLWTAYADGARATYERYRVENALSLPTTTDLSSTPVFAVTSDDTGKVWAGWYVNGPLPAVHHAYAPSEFASEPVSASLVTDWISNALPEGVIELKGAWVDPASDQKSALADLTSRAFLHAMRLLGVRYAYCSAAEHAASRWFNSGARELPDIIPARYPDDRYRTTMLCWDMATSLELSTPEQRALFEAECEQVTGDPAERIR